MSDNSLRQTLDEFLDWLSDLPEEQQRHIFANHKLPSNVDFRWTIGGTEYVVTSHFNPNAEDDFLHKLIRLLEGEVVS